MTDEVRFTLADMRRSLDDALRRSTVLSRSAEARGQSERAFIYRAEMSGRAHAYQEAIDMLDAAAAGSELAERVPVVPPGSSDEIGAGTAAAENIARQPLSPAEEAEAIQRMLEHGYTASGAAKALGMSLQLVGRRLVLLDLPEDLRELWGPHGNAQPSSATSVAALLEKAPGLAPHVKKMHDAAAAGDRNGASVDYPRAGRQHQDVLRARAANGQDAARGTRVAGRRAARRVRGDGHRDMSVTPEQIRESDRQAREAKSRARHLRRIRSYERKQRRVRHELRKLKHGGKR